MCVFGPLATDTELAYTPMTRTCVFFCISGWPTPNPGHPAIKIGGPSTPPLIVGDNLLWVLGSVFYDVTYSADTFRYILGIWECTWSLFPPAHARLPAPLPPSSFSGGAHSGALFGAHDAPRLHVLVAPCIDWMPACHPAFSGWPFICVSPRLFGSSGNCDVCQLPIAPPRGCFSRNQFLPLAVLWNCLGTSGCQ